MAATILKPSPRLIELVHFRWSIPVLSELSGGGGRGGGAKFVTLSNRLGVGPESLRRTLSALIDQGWVRRNQGYGHPLRSEYLLTSQGIELALGCSKLVSTLDDIGIAAEALRKWSLPVTLAMGSKRVRFSDIRQELPGVTARALVMTLKELQCMGLLERRVIHDYPPRPVYSLANDGVMLARRVRLLQQAIAA